MLFNSPLFLFVFLPICLVGFRLLARLSWSGALAFLTVASVVFYAWWDPIHSWPMVLSICANYAFGLALIRLRDGGWGGPVLILGVGLNLALLGWFKYAGFFATTLNQLAGFEFEVASSLIPLGISFFTFTQIAYLVDVRRREASEPGMVNYALFVTFFPHLIAGPIIHHKEMMPQFGSRKRASFNEDLAAGSAMFIIGLGKKLLLADPVVKYVTGAFTTSALGEPLGMIEAWQAALAYTVQIYFDFSAYSDMALGLARMFGIDLPVNFNSPYKSRNIIEFWRRWHMTLSRFLRDYLYFSLGGNRRGPWRRQINLMLVMLIGGLWHGAAWTFIIWGGLHGIYLVINHLWREWRGEGKGGALAQTASWALTLLAVVVAWVFFRAHSLGAALGMLAGMAGLHGLSSGSGGVAATSWQGLATVAGLLVISLVAPNSQQIMRLCHPGLAKVADPEHFGRLAWRPTPLWAVALAVLTVISVFSLWSPTEFLYYQF
ncbi:membrane-bound O-acyltransferase family protein [Paramagnetospirillum kuznetsovii]|uniref:Probable alginate O-acetylase AlgI n=1 Tax=Paramagnetospirillum kuznetsovii TaxID=2053833 RepID=A0A364NXH6_9PROT|nr:MBOAT family protein [Paramagnetospirillum kuznetsovii]RAU21801.1 membrane-bound O-acyltransferase family protein [Paramagnetospirillum kuznetsovii]